jgi:hypothetical protein
MNENHKHIWLAFSELGDYFSRLGGSSRYFNMSESEIPLYIACELAGKCVAAFEKREFLDSQFLVAADPVLRSVNKHLAAIDGTGESLLADVKDFVIYADTKLAQDKTTRWLRFVELIKASSI